MNNGYLWGCAMEFKALFFDLDGTLINFNEGEFVKLYLGAAAKFFSDLIPNPKTFVEELLKSTAIMEKADNPDTTTLEVFVNDFCPKFEIDCQTIMNRFEDFYHKKFNVIQPIIKQMNGVKEILSILKNSYSDIPVLLTTNPVFPYIAVKKRMEWGGLIAADFDHITHAENSYYCKGNDKYWYSVLEYSKTKPENTLVVGNDAFRDLRAKKLGFKTYLVDENIENEESLNENIPDYRGSLVDLLALLKA